MYITEPEDISHVKQISEITFKEIYLAANDSDYMESNKVSIKPFERMSKNL